MYGNFLVFYLLELFCFLADLRSAGLNSPAMFQSPSPNIPGSPQINLQSGLQNGVQNAPRPESHENMETKKNSQDIASMQMLRARNILGKEGSGFQTLLCSELIAGMTWQYTLVLLACNSLGQPIRVRSICNFLASLIPFFLQSKPDHNQCSTMFVKLEFYDHCIKISALYFSSTTTENKVLKLHTLQAPFRSKNVLKCSIFRAQWANIISQTCVSSLPKVFLI